MADNTDRAALIKLLKSDPELLRNAGVSATATLRLADLPIAGGVVPVRHGRWVPIRESEITGWNPEFAGNDPIGGYYCSECKKEAVFDCNDEYVLSDFCPNCGAKMDGGTADD